LASQPDTGFASGFPAADAKRRSVGGMIVADESRGAIREDPQKVI